MARTPARFTPVLAILCLAVAVPAARTLALQRPAPPATPAPSIPPAFIDVVVAGRDPRATDIFGPEDFTVTVDGQPRRVLGVRHVSRGPGAASAASARVASRAGVTFAAEPTRTILVVIDQTMLRRGDERGVIQAVGALLDRLGLEDLVAIVRLPLSSTTPVAFTTDRPGARDALLAVAGLAAPSGGLPTDDKAIALGADRTVAGDPDRASAGDPDRTSKPPEQLAPRDVVPALPEGDVERARASVAGLANLMKGLQPLPGRKIVALFAGGLPQDAALLRSQMDLLAGAAAAARSVVYAFGFRQVDDRQPGDLSSMETLARRTGGVFLVLEKDPSRTVERILPDLSACYVLSVESAATDTDGRAHALRVDTARKGFSVRFPAFLVPRTDPDDPVAGEPSGAGVPAALTRGGAGARRDNRASPRDTELEVALSRLGEYVEAYQRTFSAVVAEENYVQSIPGSERKLRSDFLLVRPENADAWVSFRDVFEVDGQPVRDRDDRLKRLFLDNPTTEALARVQAVQDESARYNIGNVSRNVNVPLFALKVARKWNQPRFHFTLGSKGDSEGVATWRIEYEERIRPTLVKNPRTGADVPLKGSFLLDAVTGAILESVVEANDVDVQGRFVVRYKRDSRLGLWVPDTMTESYRTPPGWYSTMQGRATYSNFRRFQVKTEEKITIPK